MAKVLELEAAEREANEIGKKFAYSNDVVADMSRAYHADFSDINIHTDSAADAKVKSAGKDAIASGRDLYFGAGIYESNDPASKGLVAHELAHTMQQGIVGDGHISGVSETVPYGAEQGGLIDMFKGLFKKKPKKIEKVLAKKDESAEAKAYMARVHAMDKEIADRQTDRALEKVAPIVGRKATVKSASEEAKNANKAARKAGVAKGDAYWNRNQNVSGALVEMGYRENLSELAINDRKEREEIFGNANEQDVSKMTGLSTQMVDYFNAVIDSGFDFNKEMVQSRRVRERNRNTGEMDYTTFAKRTGGDFFNMLAGYLETEEGLRYLKDVYQDISQAQVFQESDEKSVLRYILQTIINRESGRINNAMAGIMKEKNADVSMTSLAVQATGGAATAVMKLPIIAEDKELYDKSSQEVRDMVDQYKALEARLAQKIKG